MRAFRGIALLIALAIAAIVFWVARTDRPEQPDTSAVVAQIRRLNELATVKYTVQKVVPLEEQAYPVGSERILLILQATVTAGVDLAGMRPGDVRKQPDGSVMVRLPAARILNVAVDEKQTRVWDRQKTWWTPWVPYSKELEGKARAAGLEAVRQAALDMGILNQAAHGAEASVRGLLELSGVTRAIVISAGSS